jgi:hypothetical protein
MAQTYFMHTMDGKPATFSPEYGGYIYFEHTSHGPGKPGKPCTLATSIAQIKREQQLDYADRIKTERNPGVVYGYVRVQLP